MEGRVKYPIEMEFNVLGIDTLPVYSLIHNENVTSVYLVCYSSALKSGGADLPSYLADIDILYNVLATIDDMRVDLFEGGNHLVKSTHFQELRWFQELPSLHLLIFQT